MEPRANGHRTNGVSRDCSIAGAKREIFMAMRGGQEGNPAGANIEAESAASLKLGFRAPIAIAINNAWSIRENNKQHKKSL
jgi:hypothetical protein